MHKIGFELLRSVQNRKTGVIVGEQYVGVKKVPGVAPGGDPVVIPMLRVYRRFVQISPVALIVTDISLKYLDISLQSLLKWQRARRCSCGERFH